MILRDVRYQPVSKRICTETIPLTLKRRKSEKFIMNLTNPGIVTISFSNIAGLVNELLNGILTVMNFRVPKNAGKFLSGCTISSFSGRARLRKLSK
jgi:hypothetical protein